MSVYRTNP